MGVSQIDGASKIGFRCGFHLKQRREGCPRRKHTPFLLGPPSTVNPSDVRLKLLVELLAPQELSADTQSATCGEGGMAEDLPCQVPSGGNRRRPERKRLGPLQLGPNRFRTNYSALNGMQKGD